ncbi:MAG TPA: DUF1538 domain-containing protein [bacterium]|nr:DUF1538 domain-containing protein [bacterium]
MPSVCKKKIKISFDQSVLLLVPYCKTRLLEQIRSVLPVIIYLIFFQTVILDLPLADSSIISLGMALVILGLAFFMEGLLLGIMPLGEIIGVKLPIKSGLVTIIIFSFILGVGATLAEPSISVLKAAGSFVKPWDAPLLFLLLNRHAGLLVAALGIGVGIAVIAGMLRFMYSISLKPFLYTLIPFLLIISIWGIFDKNILYLTGLAWDCGAVTTGPVTVPLVLALGIGICRSVGGEDSGTMGFGVVTLASAFPIVAVLILGIFFNTKVPAPMSQEAFFNESNRVHAEYLAGSSLELEKLANTYLGKGEHLPDTLQKASGMMFAVTKNFLSATQAIFPLTLFLLIVFIIILRERLGKKDEIFFGIFISIIGMGLFNFGIEFGLAKMGTQVGKRLPSSFSAIEIPEDTEIIKNFNPEIVNKSIDSEGNVSSFFYKRSENHYVATPFYEENFEQSSSTYRYVPKKGPLFGRNGGIGGFIVVLIFAFIMGYGATLAEPALNALGMKVEELTVGTFKKSLLMHTVATGVGVGIAVGAAKIIWDISLIWLLAPPYLILLIITKFSSEEFVNIGWDSAGVTTGPVTVPLVLAMGLGIGTQVGVVEGFGILSLASVYPILGVLLVGLYTIRKSKKLLLSNNDVNEMEGEL